MAVNGFDAGTPFAPGETTSITMSLGSRDVALHEYVQIRTAHPSLLRDDQECSGRKARGVNIWA